MSASGLDTRLKALEIPQPGNPQSDLALNVVIRNLPEKDNETTPFVVNALVKDGLKLKDIVCVSAERKRSFNDRYPGVVIAKFGSVALSR